MVECLLGPGFHPYHGVYRVFWYRENYIWEQMVESKWQDPILRRHREREKIKHLSYCVTPTTTTTKAVFQPALTLTSSPSQDLTEIAVFRVEMGQAEEVLIFKPSKPSLTLARNSKQACLPLLP